MNSSRPVFLFFFFWSTSTSAVASKVNRTPDLTFSTGYPLFNVQQLISEGRQMALPPQRMRTGTKELHLCCRYHWPGPSSEEPLWWATVIKGLLPDLVPGSDAKLQATGCMNAWSSPPPLPALFNTYGPIGLSCLPIKERTKPWNIYHMKWKVPPK